MFYKVKDLSFLLAFTIIAPGLASSAALSVNGTCELGACSSVDTLGDGGTASGNVNFTYTFGNGDRYQVSGAYLNTNSFANGSAVSIFPSAVYLGNTGNAGAASKMDVLSISFLQSFATVGSLDGYYEENLIAGVGGPIASSSTYAAQLFENGQGLGLLGPYGPGVNSAFSQAQLTGLTGPLASNFEFTFTFGAGSDPTSFISTLTSATPEPGAAMLLGLGAFGLLAKAAWGVRRKSQEKV